MRNFFALLLFLVWEYPSNELAGITFNIYSKTNLAQPWQFLTNVAGLRCEIAGTNEVEFFGAKAVKDGIESEFATR